MLIGAHVSSAGGPTRALERAEAMGAAAMQLHLGSPRVWKAVVYGEGELARFARRREESRRVGVVVCHASYLVNLASAEDWLLEKSRVALVENLDTASRLGAAALVLHPGSHRGAGFEHRLAHVARELELALDVAGEIARLRGRAACPLLLENTAGAGGTIGRSFEELRALVDAAGGDERLGACVDTQHLFASGVGFDSLDEADAVVSALERAVGLGRLGCLHVNDSAVPQGANRDRHANLGEGFIGRRALGNLLSHPALQGLPAILEVPGADRHGPGRADLAAARAIRSAGLRRRQATQPPPPAPRRGRGGRRGSRPGPAR